MKLGRTLYVKTRREWRSWLAHHSRTAPEIWLVFYRKASGKPRIPYDDAVEEALCYGWIDSIEKGIDRDRFAQRFSPRRPGSPLSPMNRERVRRLAAAGKMTRAGWAAIQQPVPGKLAGPGRLTLARDVRAALQTEPAVWRNFSRFPASYKRIRIGWIEGARKRPDEFNKRLRYFVQMTRKNKRFGMVQ